ncbi:EKC/KEOPS complex subunit LAGE3-like [Limulus polyphemus]|uniref:EKC/KEOPS complex subunit LAGE3-like n=1 Tax=Limulus polyphemus TaxID=6850 RepID=A0ABM1TAR5_LIMPO|nr:EKC/KEOPS complex subunit LAGE3-like [Limulus polyphemus]
MFVANLSVPFPSDKEAEIAYHSLRVDVEPSRGGTEKVLSVEENTLSVKIVAKEARQLRVSVNSFFDLLILVIKTLERFGPPVDSK